MLKKLAALAIAASLGGIAHADELQAIKAKGVLVVGVKADYPPFGYLNPNGQIVGIEPSLAANVAQRLGVKLQLVPVVGANRLQFLEQGKIDLLIATMSDTPEREKVVDIVHPDYYASGYNLMVAKTVDVKSWSELKGVPVCAIQASFYNKEVEQKYGAELVAFTGVAEALTALRQGRCDAFLYDDTAIEGKLSDPQWADYDMPLQTQDAKPWGLAVKQGEPAFAAFMSDTIKDWDKTGYIQTLEQQYHVRPSAFAAQMHKQFAGS
jgi:polar amino acid transport system substrate-binding protein